VAAQDSQICGRNFPKCKKSAAVEIVIDSNHGAEHFAYSCDYILRYALSHVGDAGFSSLTVRPRAWELYHWQLYHYVTIP